MFELDHIAVVAGGLQEGVDAVEQALGVALAGGGEHPVTGTHNRLLGLGDVYLEVIAINPAAPKPEQPRWFDLDNLTGPPRLANWIVRCDDLDAAIVASPKGVGDAVDLKRGDLRWRMSKSADGRQPFGNAYPAMIQWHGTKAADVLPDSGCRLRLFEISHPQADDLNHALAGNITDNRVSIQQGSSISYRAEIETPHGLRVLE